MLEPLAAVLEQPEQVATLLYLAPSLQRGAVVALDGILSMDRQAVPAVVVASIMVDLPLELVVQATHHQHRHPKETTEETH